jgi:hypothetical protein
MATLTPTQLDTARVILDMVRFHMRTAAGTDAAHYAAIRRYVARKLTYDERNTPMHRRALKARKRREQGGKCAGCAEPLPATDVVLDRLRVEPGNPYTATNTRLVCRPCDYRTQRACNFT